MEAVKLDSKIGWIVVVACAAMNFLLMIPLKLSGLFFVQILDRYQVGRNLAGYPIVIMTVIRCSGGPLAGYLAERFGLNRVLILGSVLSALGISACFIAEDIATVIVFLGIVHGFGVAFTNTFFPIIMKLHFRKYITLAFGMTQAGSSLGAFLAPPLLLWIFQSYGTSGGFLLIGAIVLHSLPFVLILNILSPNRLHKLMKSKNTTEKTLEIGEATPITSSDCKDLMNYHIGGKEEKCENKKDNEHELRKSFVNKVVDFLVLDRAINESTDAVSYVIDDAQISPFEEQTMSITPEGNSLGWGTEKDRREKHGIIPENKWRGRIPEKETEITSNRIINVSKKDFKIPIPVADSQTNLMTQISEEDEINSKDLLQHRVGDIKNYKYRKESDSVILPIYISASNPVTDCGNTPSHMTIECGHISPRSLRKVNEDSLEYVRPSNQEVNQNEVRKIDKKLIIESTDAKYKKANKSLMLFLDVTFWVVMICNAIYIFVLMTFWTTMIDFSRDKNIDRSKEVYLLMALAIAELLGRLGLGWITDNKYLSTTNFCILSFVGMGISCSLMAITEEFYLVIVCICAFSILTGGILIVLPMMIFEFFESDKHAMGQAAKLSLFGPISCLSGPFIGFFRGTLGSYAWLYHMLAILSAACAANTALIPVLARIRDKKKEIQRS